jgi:hypothetical protein
MSAFYRVRYGGNRACMDANTASRMQGRMAGAFGGSASAANAAAHPAMAWIVADSGEK